MANSASRSLKRESIMSTSGVHNFRKFKARVCAFNICRTFQSSDASLISGLHSDPYFLSLQSVVNSASTRFASGVHDFRSASVFLNSCFLSLQKFNSRVFFLLTGYGHVVSTGFSVFVASIEVDMKRPVRLIGDHLRSQNFCLMARKIRTVLDTHQDIIGHDAPIRSWILLTHNEHGTVEGHGKEDITSKVLDPPFTNLLQRSDNNEKLMLIR